MINNGDMFMVNTQIDQNESKLNHMSIYSILKEVQCTIKEVKVY